jgi:hypothetical protein
LVDANIERLKSQHTAELILRDPPFCQFAGSKERTCEAATVRALKDPDPVRNVLCQHAERLAVGAVPAQGHS